MIEVITTNKQYLGLKKWLLQNKVIAIDSETRPGMFPAEMIMFQIGDVQNQ